MKERGESVIVEEGMMGILEGEIEGKGYYEDMERIMDLKVVMVVD